MSYVQTAEVSSRPWRGHIDSVMYTNHYPGSHRRSAPRRLGTDGQQAQVLMSKRIPLRALLVSGTRQGIVLVSHEAYKYHRVNSCNVHYQRSVDPMEGTRPAQILCSSRWMLCTGTPQWHTPTAARGWSSPGRAKSFGEPRCERMDPAPGHTMLASSVLSDSELLLLSSLQAKGWG